MKSKKINEEILTLWIKYNDKQQKGTERYPLFYPKFNINCDVLFIGINPSFIEGKSKQNFRFVNKEFKIQQAIDEEKKLKINVIKIDTLFTSIQFGK